MEYIDSYRKAFIYIKSDYVMSALHGNTLRRYIIDYFKDRSIRFTFWLRLSSHKKGLLYPLCKFMWKRYSIKYCLEIRPETLIGKGFRLIHGLCVVINKNSQIGENVRIFQFTTIGEKNGNSPIIKNGVTIYANSTILGG